MINQHQRIRANWALILLFGGLVAAILSPCASHSQEEKGGAELKAKFYEKFKGGDPKNPALRLIRDGNFNWEAAGARVTMPPGEGKIPTAGIAANFKIKGDFEIIASYEILKADKPTEGYGVGVILFAAIDTDTMNTVSLSRRHMPKGGVLFVSDRMRAGADGKPEHYPKVRPAKAAIGKLRIKRVGSMIRFYTADGEGAEFQPIIQDGKAKTIDLEFGAGEIRYFQIGGDAGDSQAALDMRLFDLTVLAEELPGYSDAPPPKNAPPGPRPPWMLVGQAPAETASNKTLYFGGGAVVVLAVLGVGAWLYLGKRRKTQAAPNPKAEPDTEETVKEKPSPGIPFSCSKCERKIVVKSALAGKRIKCPQCGASLPVPQT